MQHGAPPHSVLPVRAWLGNYFPRWWIGRGEKENGRHDRPIVLRVILFFWSFRTKWKSRTLHELKQQNVDFYSRSS
jgi:hypothetical protein